MRKILLVILFGVIVLWPLIAVTPTNAIDQATPSVDKGDNGTYNYGDQITLTVSGIPFAWQDPKDNSYQSSNVAFDINKVAGNANTGSTVGSVGILTTSYGNKGPWVCSAQPEAGQNIWIANSISCLTAGGKTQSTGDPFIFTGKIDSTKLGIDPNSTSDTAYTVTIVNEAGCTTCHGSIQFIIKAPKSNTDGFKIVSINDITTPKSLYSTNGFGTGTAKPGDKIEIDFSPEDTTAQYSWGVPGNKEGKNQSGSCTPSTEAASVCTVTWTLPSDANGKVVINVLNHKTGKTASATITVDSLTPIPQGVNVATAPTLVPTDTPTPTPLPPLPPCASKIADIDYVPNPNDASAEGSFNYHNFTQCNTVATGLGIFVPTDPQGFIQSIFAILLSVSGGIAILLIIRSGYQMMTASGDPEKLKNAKEILSSAIIGLLFLIFSLIILEIIGVDLLHIPGLSH